MKLNMSESLLVRSIGCGLAVSMLGTSILASTNPIKSIHLEEPQEAHLTTFSQIVEPIPEPEIRNTVDITEYREDLTEEDQPLETYLMYVDRSSVYYRSRPIIDDRTTLGTLNKGEEVDVIDQNGEWCKCVVDDEVVYIYAELLAEECTAEDIIEANKLDYSVTTLIYDSEVPLTANLGRVAGPSGEETYYNLNMKNCVARMHDLGYEGEYWIREDGVKMFGDYVMIAANFDIRPLGTVLETSLGAGIVTDCGDFVEDNPTGIDIATNW